MRRKLTFSKILWMLIFTIINSGCENFSKTPSNAQTTQTKVSSESDALIGIRNTIYFDFNSSKLNENEIAMLNQHVKLLQKVNHYKELRIIGNTDKNGSYSYNLLLGQKRANAVIDYLIKNGIDGTKLKAISYGEKYATKSSKLNAQYRNVKFEAIY